MSGDGAETINQALSPADWVLRTACSKAAIRNWVGGAEAGDSARAGAPARKGKNERKMVRLSIQKSSGG